ncbi:LYR motif-containing protein 2 [Coemansia sp. RSA 2424]|nr:LYR motif-containing protein 2 [Coemansia sp. RSA 2424]
MSRVTRPALSLQQFIQRGQVIAMYRKFMRLTKRAPDKPSRREMREWIRVDFDRYRTEADPRRIDVLLAQASRQYKNMESGMFPMN